jgi:hypothetical protein
MSKSSEWFLRVRAEEVKEAKAFMESRDLTAATLN